MERLALLDTNPHADTPERMEIRRKMLDRFNAGEVDAVVQDFLDLVVPPSRLNEEELIAPMRAMMKSVAEQALADQVKALIARPDSRPDFGRYKLPVRLICGREDLLTPLALHEEMENLIPGARLSIIENCAHMSTMERPDEVNAVLRDWLLND